MCYTTWKKWLKIPQAATINTKLNLNNSDHGKVMDSYTNHLGCVCSKGPSHPYYHTAKLIYEISKSDKYLQEGQMEGNHHLLKKKTWEMYRTLKNNFLDKTSTSKWTISWMKKQAPLREDVRWIISEKVSWKVEVSLLDK